MEQALAQFLESLESRTPTWLDDYDLPALRQFEEFGGAAECITGICATH